MGNGDLLYWLKQDGININNIEIYDIDPKPNIKNILPNINLTDIIQDTLLNPPNYENKFVITNPPYLAKNKSKLDNNKKLFNKYPHSDLYRIFIHQIIRGNCHSGIIIIPLNFFSSLKKQDITLRKNFMKRYKIIKLNIFEEQVFDNTTYTVCSMKFIRNNINMLLQKINVTFYPKKLNKNLIFEDNKHWLLGGDIYTLGIQEKKYLIIKRIEYKHINTYKQEEYILTNIFANLLDSGTQSGKIKLEYKKEPYIGKTTDRVFATIIIKPLKNIQQYTNFLNIKENQIMIIQKFNNIITTYREKYHSLFLSNYREAKNGDGRKRCSFGLCYGLLRHIIHAEISKK